MHLKSLVFVIAALVNMATTLPDPQDHQNPGENQVIHFIDEDKKGNETEVHERHGHHSDGQEKHDHHQSDGHDRHGDHSEIENFPSQSKPIPTKQNDHSSHGHHHVHSTQSSGVPHQNQFSQFFPPQQFGQSQPAQQFGQFPQGQLPFGYQQPSNQLLNCQCYPASQPFSHFQQPQQYNAFTTGFQQPSQQFNPFPSGFQQPSQQFNALPTGFQQPSQQFNALPTGFQQPSQQSSSKQARPHCHITCHEH